MKILAISTVLLFGILTSCHDHSNHGSVDLTGHWYWQLGDRTFTLDIIQTHDFLKEQYCSIFAGGDHFDCGVPPPPGVTVTKESQYNLFGHMDKTKQK